MLCLSSAASREGPRVSRGTLRHPRGPPGTWEYPPLIWDSAWPSSGRRQVSQWKKAVCRCPEQGRCPRLNQRKEGEPWPGGLPTSHVAGGGEAGQIEGRGHLARSQLRHAVHGLHEPQLRLRAPVVRDLEHSGGSGAPGSTGRGFAQPLPGGLGAEVQGSRAWGLSQAWAAEEASHHSCVGRPCLRGGCAGWGQRTPKWWVLSLGSLGPHHSLNCKRLSFSIGFSQSSFSPWRLRVAPKRLTGEKRERSRSVSAGAPAQPSPRRCGVAEGAPPRIPVCTGEAPLRASPRPPRWHLLRVPEEPRPILAHGCVIWGLPAHPLSPPGQANPAEAASEPDSQRDGPAPSWLPKSHGGSPALACVGSKDGA